MVSFVYLFKGGEKGRGVETFKINQYKDFSHSLNWSSLKIYYLV